MAAVMRHTAKVSRTIPAPVARVYQAWTDPALLGRWFAPGEMSCTVHECDPQVGGRFRVEMHGEEGSYSAFGEYLEVLEGRRLAMTWAWEKEFEDIGDAAGSLLTVEFDEVDGATEIRLTHDKLESEKSAVEHSKGWEGCLVNLESRIAQF